MLMSGVPRALPTTDFTPFWKSGRSKTGLTPPPLAAWIPTGLSFHTTSGESRLPASLRFSCVPPTLVTSGSLDGQLFTCIG